MSKQSFQSTANRNSGLKCAYHSSVYRFNLSGGFTILEERRSGISLDTCSAGDVRQGVLGVTEVMCSLVEMIPLGWALGAVVQPISGDTGSGSVMPVLLLLCVLTSSPVGRMWRRFRVKVLPFAKATTYERGVCTVLLITPGSHLWLCGFRTRTGSLGCKAGRIFEVLSYCDFCWSCLLWSLAFTSPSADKEMLGLETAGRLVWYTLAGWLAGWLEMGCYDQAACFACIAWQDEGLHKILCIFVRGSLQFEQFFQWSH